MKVSMIAAMDLDRGIGKDNDLLWNLPADMRFFKETTQGHIVVMGRKNYDSIPERFRPLPNRENAILTRDKSFEAPGCLVFHSLEEVFAHYKNETERTVFIIGGGQVFKEAWESGLVTELFITVVNERYDADTHMIDMDVRDWKVEKLMEHPVDEKHAASFITYRYSKQPVHQF